MSKRIETGPRTSAAAFLAICSTAIFLSAIANAQTEPESTSADLSIPALEMEIARIDAELATLASYSLRSGLGTVGYRSLPREVADSEEWVEIDFEEEQPIDSIVLVPAIWRGTESNFEADGFPLRFRLLALHGEEGDVVEIASFGPEDDLLPRIAPVIIEIPSTKASGLRLEASTLSHRYWDNRPILQLAEIFVFSGEENVALRRPVTTSSRDDANVRQWGTASLVDGFVPYLMDASGGARSLAFASISEVDTKPNVIVDLGQTYSIQRIHFHRTDLSDTVPQGTPSDFGIPRRMLVEGSETADFENSVSLSELVVESAFDIGPIIMRNFPATDCRYIRLVALEPHIAKFGKLERAWLGLAEIEIFSEGRNVAKGADAFTDESLVTVIHDFAALTDGRNLYGDILPIREWMNQLARRHDLEKERPALFSQLNERYAKQEKLLTQLGIVVAVLVAILAITVLITRLSQMRRIAAIRERLAADLHDELGANVHTIGLLSDIAQESRDSPEELSELHRRIRDETQRTGVAIRHCTDMLGAKGLYADLETDMRRAARRIMAKLDHEIVIEGEEHLRKLRPRVRADLFLFYKESLVNISRHSEATEFATRLEADERKVHLLIEDNGIGIEHADGDGTPKSLKRRARLLRAKVSVENRERGGTRIHLHFPVRRWMFEK